MVRHSTFSLGKFGYAINITCLAWIVLAVVIFCMPVSLPVTASTMNYASVVFMGFAAISIAWYFIRGRKTFTGPPVVADANPTLEGKPHPVDGDGELGYYAEEPLKAPVHSEGVTRHA
jgi:hypothetical protein